MATTKIPKNPWNESARSVVTGVRVANPFDPPPPPASRESAWQAVLELQAQRDRTCGADPDLAPIMEAVEQSFTTGQAPEFLDPKVELVRSGILCREQTGGERANRVLVPFWYHAAGPAFLVEMYATSIPMGLECQFQLRKSSVRLTRVDPREHLRLFDAIYGDGFWEALRVVAFALPEASWNELRSALGAVRDEHKARWRGTKHQYGCAADKKLSAVVVTGIDYALARESAWAAEDARELLDDPESWLRDGDPWRLMPSLVDPDLALAYAKEYAEKIVSGTPSGLPFDVVEALGAAAVPVLTVLQAETKRKKPYAEALKVAKAAK